MSRLSRKEIKYRKRQIVNHNNYIKRNYTTKEPQNIPNNPSQNPQYIYKKVKAKEVYTKHIAPPEPTPEPTHKFNFDFLDGVNWDMGDTWIYVFYAILLLVGLWIVYGVINGTITFQSVWHFLSQLFSGSKP